MSKILTMARPLVIHYSRRRWASLWSYFRQEKNIPEPEKPPPECCRKSRPNKPDPDLSAFEGKPYKTCGTAYVIQKDVIPPSPSKEVEEDRILRKMEADLTTKDGVDDPMPPFRSVEQRLLDLTERRLHPFYKRYMTLPKRRCVVVEEDPKNQQQSSYQCKNGPVDDQDLPECLKVNKELLEKKNIFADFKRVEIPQQMLVRMLEMRKNRKPTLERKK